MSILRQTSRKFAAALLLCFSASGAFPVSAAESLAPAASPPAATPWNEEFAYLTGMQAYIYAFPAIMYANLRYQWIESGQGQVQMGVNQYWHSRGLSDPKLQYGGSPNRETPYSLAMLDLREPMVLSVPANPDERYYTLQLMDFYSDTIGYVGVRATDNVAGDYLVTGPGWQGEVPKGIKGVIPSWTPWAFIAGRTYTDGSAADLLKMRAFQDGYQITPLSHYGQPAAQVAVRHDVLDVAPKTDPLGAFKTMNAVLRENPPPARDAALLTQFALVGLGPQAKGSIDELDPAIQRGLQRAIVDGQALLGRVAKAGGSITGATRTQNGWFYGPSNWGRMAADGDFLGRAGTQAFSGITEHLIEETVKLRTFVDSEGQPLNGDHHYVIHFSKEQIPLAKSFWSVTLYDQNFNLVFNEAGRYSFGDKVPGLIYGKDGSLDIYIQPEQPAGDKAANWLPSPKGKEFNLFLRAYFPGPSLLDQSYAAPAVQKVAN
ncbi:DUF1254 domain-containing protein [Pseudomonas sp. N040]|uniref:DUF1254 domain-containing protein n=1 Tax=Pseudomonas sp. N040 TaxID=2785325 RepID=UPI0018A2EF9D|nr:DUF1254 domain-containing protein [Pseudomonas sp. N040]MBF7729082.1 DUF1254 domain-containing protein [Pseudomonas sp. N040]MBW7012722.1 DUF1214 domain-containing protein [Pseudomonas sp. N040]